MGLKKGAPSDDGDAVEVQGAGGPPALIDRNSQADYKKQYEKHRLQNKHAFAESLHHVNKYIKKEIDGIVDQASSKSKMDVFTTGSSVMCSSMVPCGGIPVVVAATVMECINFAATLGLIPVFLVRYASDLKAMTSQVSSSISTESKGGLMADVEAAVLEILEKLGLGDWLWTEILKDNILAEVVINAFLDSTWVMTPIFAAAKYKLHRRLIKKMNRKLGDKAHVVHFSWTEHHCIITV